MLNAPILLPALYKDSSWEKMQNFSDNWKNEPVNCPEIIFCLETLLAIQQNKYNPTPTPCNLFYYLTDYAKEVKLVKIESRAFKYYVSIEPNVSYDATSDAFNILSFTQQWALNLCLQRPWLTSQEAFLCKVFSGEITDPISYYTQHKTSLSAFDSLQTSINENKKLLYQKSRNSYAFTSSIQLGDWLPQGNLKTVIGNHPSVGLELGYRNKLNEYSTTYAYRFLSSSVLPYTFVRQDSIFKSNYYVGFNFCLEYTRYLVHENYFDLGLTTGVGIDYFNQFDQNKYSGDSTIKMSPVNLNSFDFCNGIRLKYFFHNGTCIGLVAKYHLMNYCNNGGTDLGGNAYTIDLFFGKH